MTDKTVSEDVTFLRGVESIIHKYATAADQLLIVASPDESTTNTHIVEIGQCEVSVASTPVNKPTETIRSGLNSNWSKVLHFARIGIRHKQLD